MPKLVHIPFAYPFLDSVVAAWMQRSEERMLKNPSQKETGVLIVPTRRAARTLHEAFLRYHEGKAALLPRIVSLGAVEEIDMLVGGEEALTIRPPILPQQRIALLAQLVIKMRHTLHMSKNPDKTEEAISSTLSQTWAMAQSLADLMDEVEWQERPLGDILHQAIEENYAQHWQETLKFLEIITHFWPLWLEENEMMNPVSRQTTLLHRQAHHWEKTRPSHKIWAVGFTDGLPAVAHLLSSILGLPNGCLIMQGIDFSLTEEQWNNLPETHPQRGFKDLFVQLAVKRKAFESIDAVIHNGLLPPASALLMQRTRLLSKALLPAEALEEWQKDPHLIIPEGLSVLNARNPQEEAMSIALILRDGINVPGRKVALVTPDRNLARRVVAELQRWGIWADDSAGLPLLDSNPAVFLRLLCEAVTSGFAPVALLSVLKHPLAAFGRSVEECRSLSRLLEITLLRGSMPAAGFDALQKKLLFNTNTRTGSGLNEEIVSTLSSWIKEVELRFSCMVQWAGGSLSEALVHLIECAELCASTDIQNGAERLWVSEEGTLLADHLTEMISHTKALHAPQWEAVQSTLQMSLMGQVVRQQRQFKDGEVQRLHPRVFIWGVIEARLQNVDWLVLGGLNEDIWPPATDPGPWLNRLMRKNIGLAQPEKIIGTFAHDFLANACGAEKVIFSLSARRDGAPAVKARWLTRLQAYIEGLIHHVSSKEKSELLQIKAEKALSWARMLDRASHIQPAAPPMPCPAVHLRPRRLSISDISLWIKDPYAIYAKHILHLRPLPPLQKEADASDFGLIVHAGLEKFLRHFSHTWSQDIHHHLEQFFYQSLVDYGPREAQSLWWKSRLRTIAQWVVEHERDYRALMGEPKSVGIEKKGRLFLDTPGGQFQIYGYADRIQREADQTITIIDYKTGTVPAQKRIEAGWEPQLPLEALIALKGGFGAPLKGEVKGLLFWSLKGDYQKGKVEVPFKDNEKIHDNITILEQGLVGWIHAFDQPDQPYLSHPRREFSPHFSDYAHLARLEEWSIKETESNG